MTTALRDPLADVLALLRPETIRASDFHVHGRCAIATEAHPHVKFGTIVEGEGIIAVRGLEPVTFGRGDFYVLGNPPPYVIASDLTAKPRSVKEVFDGTKPGAVVRIGRPGTRPYAHLIGGHLALDAANAGLLAGALPPITRIPAERAGALRDVGRLLVDEVIAAHPGRGPAIDHLAQLLLTYALRTIGADTSRSSWLRALADPRIGPVIRDLHANVAARPSLDALARVAGMSRTAFVERFKELVGQAPQAYAIHWRMSLAKDALRNGDRAIGQLAFDLGYESESAFSTAFRRVVGASPREYRAAVMAVAPR